MDVDHAHEDTELPKVVAAPAPLYLQDTMTTIMMSPSVLSPLLDSGPPAGSAGYTTLIFIHGLMWHAPTFKKLLPLSALHNARVIALNRPDYPGSTPYTTEESALLRRLASVSGPEDTATSRDEADAFIRNRAQELYDALLELIERENIPAISGEGQDARGGIILTGWSFGVLWILGFLTHAPSSSSSSVDLRRYIRRVISFDGSYNAFGYPHPPRETYHPLHDKTLSPEASVARAHEWLAAYYTHGDPIEPDTLMLRDTPDQPSTLANMSPEERAESTYEAPGLIGDGPGVGSDLALGKVLANYGLGKRLRESALYLAKDDYWRDVELRIVWCDRSIWAMPWAARSVAAELEEAKKAGKATRKVSIVRIRGGNHFAHWDFPEQTLRAFLGNDAVEVQV